MDKNVVLISHIDFEDDKSIIKAIKTVKSGIYLGKECIVSVQRNVGIRVSTYQSNGWIRINDYDLGKDELVNEIIIRSETYEKY